jgi:hypothetical protein
MLKNYIGLSILLLSFVLGYVTCSQVKLNVEYPKHIEAETIRLKSSTGHEVSIIAGQGYAAMWLTDKRPDGPISYLFNGDAEGPHFGVYGNGSRTACDAAFGINGYGETILQYKTKDGNHDNLLEGK